MTALISSPVSVGSTEGKYLVYWPVFSVHKLQYVWMEEFYFWGGSIKYYFTQMSKIKDLTKGKQTKTFT